MATDKGVWNLQQVRDKQLQSLWDYSGSSDEPGTLWLWGWDGYGVMGQNSPAVSRSSPIQVGSDNNWKMINKRVYLAQAIKSDGTMWTWGLNEYGQLGNNLNGQPGNRSSPIQVGSGTDWSNITFGRADNYQCHAIKTDGTLWTWGRNNTGGLGQNSLTLYSSPVQVPGTNWSKGRLWNNSVYYIKTNGELWVWGQNYGGQLGLGPSVPQNTDYSSPKQVPGTSWSQVGGACAIRTDGTLWVWGHNNYGQLAQNTRTPTDTYTMSPTQVPGTNWSHVVAGKEHMVATKTDGTLWVWGENESGGLGLNTNGDDRSSPVQIPGTTWKLADCTLENWGLETTLALKTDGSLWFWGNGEAGNGLGNVVDYSSPTQIPGTWNEYFSNYYGGIKIG